MRAFIAIDLPETIREALAQQQSKFRAVCPEARWVNPRGIHLTLQFLGEVREAQVDSVVEALGALPPFETFMLEVTGLGCFPTSRRPRVLWAGLNPSPPLSELGRHVQASMGQIGFPPEERAFTPHLTLARFKDPKPQPELERALAIPSQPLGSFSVSEFFLFESKLSPRGAEYRKVAQFPHYPGDS